MDFSREDHLFRHHICATRLLRKTSHTAFVTASYSKSYFAARIYPKESESAQAQQQLTSVLVVPSTQFLPANLANNPAEAGRMSIPFGSRSRDLLKPASDIIYKCDHVNVSSCLSWLVMSNSLSQFFAMVLTPLIDFLDRNIFSFWARMTRVGYPVHNPKHQFPVFVT